MININYFPNFNYYPRSLVLKSMLKDSVAEGFMRLMAHGQLPTIYRALVDTRHQFLPPLPLSTLITLYYWVSTTGVRLTEKERVYVFVLGQKGILLPQDVAFKAEEVGFLWRKRSQNRRGLVETPCSQHFLSTGHPAAEPAARFCGKKSVPPPWEVSGKSLD